MVADSAEKPIEIAIALDAPLPAHLAAKRQQDLVKPRAANLSPLPLLTVERYLSQVEVMTPKQRSYSLTAQGMTITSHRGCVKRVDLLLPAVVMEVKSAVEIAERQLQRLALVDSALLQTILAWRPAAPNGFSYAPRYVAASAIEEGVHLIVALRHFPDVGGRLIFSFCASE